jgi:hypothetical protein
MRSMVNESEGPARRVALRGTGSLNDVVVEDVSMFRAEMLEPSRLWLACYLPGTGVEGDRITFEVAAVDGRLHFEVVESPAGQVVSE